MRLDDVAIIALTPVRFVRDSVLNSLFGEPDVYDFQGSTTPDDLSRELGKFIDEYSRSNMTHEAVSQRLELLDRIRVARPALLVRKKWL